MKPRQCASFRGRRSVNFIAKFGQNGGISLGTPRCFALRFTKRRPLARSGRARVATVFAPGALCRATRLNLSCNPHGHQLAPSRNDETMPQCLIRAARALACHAVEPEPRTHLTHELAHNREKATKPKTTKPKTTKPKTTKPHHSALSRHARAPTVFAPGAPWRATRLNLTRELT